MRAILPGRPQARYQALSTGSWEGTQIIVYISGNAIIILDGPHHILQTTYQESRDALVAVAFDEVSGKIAAASASTIHIYAPYGHDEGALRWSLQCHLGIEENDVIKSLSWGMDQELLVGSSSLTLFSTYHGSSTIWTKALASPIKFAQFSYDTGLIVTTGERDKLVKVWRTQSLADMRFDFAYLPHPAVVTGLHWRRPFHREQTFDNVLYTTCADNKMRIWVPGDPHSNEILRLWDEIDLLQSIQPRSIAPQDRSSKRYAFMIDSKDFTVATERAIQHASHDEHEQHALAHLIEIANRSPDVCVVLDDRGNMSAWGLESVGCKARKPGDIFNVAHVEGLHIDFNLDTLPIEDNVQFHTFCDNKEHSNLTVLAHYFDGRIEWYEGRPEQLFNPSPQEQRLKLKALWTGHLGQIKKVIRTPTGKAVISRTEEDRSVIWEQKWAETGSPVQRKSIVYAHEHIHRVSLLAEGNFVVFLHHSSIALWDCRRARATEIARKSYKLTGKPLCLICLPEEDLGTGLLHLVTVSSEMKGIAWEVKLPGPLDRESRDMILEEFDRFDLGAEKDLMYVLPVDPARTAAVISGFLDTFARDVAISWTKSGTLKSWTAKPDLTDRKILWLQTSIVETFVENASLGSGTSIRKAALVDADKTKLTIWNTRAGQLEHEEAFEATIQDLDWSSTPDNQSILAVGFNHHVLLYTQLRFNYLDAQPAWAAMRQINIRELTPHPIGDSVWLSNGSFIIGAGNQLFVQDDQIKSSDAHDPDIRMALSGMGRQAIFNVVSHINGPLPLFHPQLIGQTILSGKLLLAQRILLKLLKKLKFYSDGDEFDSTLGFTAEDFYASDDVQLSSGRKEMHSSYADFSDHEPDTLTDEVVESLRELLSMRKVPTLSGKEQFHLADIIECIGFVEKQRRSIDQNALRFLLIFRQYVLRASEQRSHRISWREITWAFHSQSQDILVDQVSRHYQGKMTWEDAKQCGLFMWLSDSTAVRAQFEVIARNEYTKSEDKNPVDCSLYYLALKKKAVLSGLWRMAAWNKEQAATQRLLANNFEEPKWKTTALKNAYALMGKRRFEYAAAFFLLADKLRDAVNVLSNQHGDTQLAIAVIRVYEGDDGPVLRDFIEEKIVPQAAIDGNRWLATWAYWMLGKRSKAVQAVVAPLTSLMSPPETPSLQSKLFLTDDPALIVLYRQLREKSLQTLRGALSVSPRAEWEFIVHTARLYGRMGCDLLALDLVRSWEFLQQPQVPQPRRPSSTARTSSPTFSVKSPLEPPSPMLSSFDINPRRLLRRRSSLVVADLPADDLRRPSLTDLPVHATHSYDARAPHPSAIAEYEDEQRPNGTQNGTAAKKEAPQQDEVKDKPKKREEKPPPTQFKEPDASSLLDAFGF